MDKKVFNASSGREIVYAILPGVGEPLLFLNGLGDSFECWDRVIDNAGLARPILLVDLAGQGASLDRELEAGKEMNYHLGVQDQVSSLLELLNDLKIHKFGVVGFSYGGGIALGLSQQAGPRITDLILLLPFILRLDLSFPMSRILAAQFDFFKSLTPKDLRQPFEIVEKSYDRFIGHYMNFRYSGRIPDEKKRKVAVEVSRGIMEFNSFEVIPSLPDGKLVLVTSGLDTLIPQSLYAEFWYRIPPSKKKAWIKVVNGEHLLLEQGPQLVGQIMNQALDGVIEGEHQVNLK